MKRRALMIVLTAAVCAVGGCNIKPRGADMNLGQVDYQQAFAAGRSTMSQYFSVETADPETGVISTRPKSVHAENDRLAGGYPARQVGTMTLRKIGGDVVAYVAVEVQRQRSAMRRQMRGVEENYSTVPNQTPAEHEAATTAEQNEDWEMQRYDRATQGRILDDLYRSLHPTSQSAPAQ